MIRKSLAITFTQIQVLKPVLEVMPDWSSRVGWGNQAVNIINGSETPIGMESFRDAEDYSMSDFVLLSDNTGNAE